MQLATNSAHSEHEMKTLTLQFEGARDCCKELTRSVDDGVKKVETYVESQRTSETNKAAKELENQNKERIRLEKLAKKTADAQAKKDTKHIAAGIEKGSHENSQSALFNQEGVKVKPLPRSDTYDNFTKNGSHSRSSNDTLLH